MEGAGALHRVDHTVALCLELGKEGEGDAESTSASSAGMEAGSCHSTDPWAPQYLAREPSGAPHMPPAQPGWGRDVPSLWLAAFPAELLEEISRAPHRLMLQGCVLLTVDVG